MSLSSYVALTIPAGTEKTIAATGNFVSCLEASHGEFKLATDHGAPSLFAQGLTFYPAAPFGFVRVVNTSSLVPLEVTILVGFGRLDDRRQVSTTPGGLYPITLAEVRERAYRSQHFFQGGGVPAGEDGYLQLWNPAASGVIAVISEVLVHCDVGGKMPGFAYGTALSTLWKETASVYLGDPIATGSIELRQQASGAGAVSPSSADQHVFSIRVNSNVTERIRFRQPLLLPPGVGLVVGSPSTGPLELSLMCDVLELPAT